MDSKVGIIAAAKEGASIDIPSGAALHAATQLDKSCCSY